MSASATASASRSEQLKKFSHQQIAAKCAQRSNIKDYRDLLLACAVREDSDGVVMDTGCTAWRRLRAICDEADRAAAAALTHRATTAAMSVMAKVKPVSALTIPAYGNGSEESVDGDWVKVNRPAHSQRPALTLASSVSLPDLPRPSPPSRSRHDSYIFHDLELERSLQSQLTESDSAMKSRILSERQSDSNDRKSGVSASVSDDDCALDAIIRAMNAVDENNLDWEELRLACLTVGIPTKYRGRIWQILLRRARSIHTARTTDICNSHSHTPSRDDSSSELESLLDTSLPSAFPFSPISGTDTSSGPLVVNEPPTPTVTLSVANQRVIHLDVDRSLSHLKHFQQPSVRSEMIAILTRYCQSHSVSYIQGMNYVLAPMLMLGLSTAEIDEMFAQFIALLLPNTFQSNDFGPLQYVFALFRLALQYHDPELCGRLDNNGISAEIYATGWFITVFAAKLNVECTYQLWDLLLLHSEQRLLLYFIGISLLCSSRHTILRERSEELHGLLTRLSMRDRREVHSIVNRALKLYLPMTPQSLIDSLSELTADGNSASVDSDDYIALTALPCLTVTANEIIAHLYHDNTYQPSSMAQSQKWFVVDCRSASQFRAGHLPQSFHLDPDLLGQAELLESAIEGLASMRGCHLTLMSATGAELLVTESMDQPLSLFIRMLVKRGFKYISTITGGYHSAHSIVKQQGRLNDLIDHSADVCLECNQSALLSSAAQLGGAVMSATLSRLKQVVHTVSQAMEVRPDDFSEEYKRSHLPSSVTVVASSVYIRSLHTVLRDCKSDVQAFTRALEQATNIVVGAAIDHCGVSVTDQWINTGSIGGYVGVHYPLVTVALTVTAEHLLQSTFAPLKTVCDRHRGRLVLSDSNGDSGSVSRIKFDRTLLGSERVLLYHPTLTINHRTLLTECVDYLTQRLHHPMNHIVAVSLTADSALVWSLQSHYAGLLWVTTSVEASANGGEFDVSDTTSGHSSRHSPCPIAELDARYYSQQFAHKTSERHN